MSPIRSAPAWFPAWRGRAATLPASTTWPLTLSAKRLQLLKDAEPGRSVVEFGRSRHGVALPRDRSGGAVTRHGAAFRRGTRSARFSAGFCGDCTRASGRVVRRRRGADTRTSLPGAGLRVPTATPGDVRIWRIRPRGRANGLWPALDRHVPARRLLCQLYPEGREAG